MKRKLIFAGNYRQALDYAREHQLAPSEYSIVSDQRHVLGLTPDAWEVVRVGTWYANDEVSESYQHPRWHDAIG